MANSAAYAEPNRGIRRSRLCLFKLGLQSLDVNLRLAALLLRLRFGLFRLRACSAFSSLFMLFALSLKPPAALAMRSVNDCCAFWLLFFLFFLFFMAFILPVQQLR